MGSPHPLPFTETTQRRHRLYISSLICLPSKENTLTSNPRPFYLSRNGSPQRKGKKMVLCAFMKSQILKLYYFMWYDLRGAAVRKCIRRLEECSGEQPKKVYSTNPRLSALDAKEDWRNSALYFTSGSLLSYLETHAKNYDQRDAVSNYGGRGEATPKSFWFWEKGTREFLNKVLEKLMSLRCQLRGLSFLQKRNCRNIMKWFMRHSHPWGIWTILWSYLIRANTSTKYDVLLEGKNWEWMYIGTLVDEKRYAEMSKRHREVEISWPYYLTDMKGLIIWILRIKNWKDWWE